MGLLVEGDAMMPDELKAHLKYIRQHGIIQFLHIWKRLKGVQDDQLKFGDEIECGILAVDPLNKTVKLSVRAAEVSGHFDC
jgi:glutamate--cysteine ligase catalytic subunit